MSAFLVGQEHVEYMLAAAAHFKINFYLDGRRYKYDDPADMQRIGEILYATNIEAIEDRYGPEDVSAEYRQTPKFDWRGYTVDHAQAVKACDCYDYQTSEYKGWRFSDAREISNDIVRRIAALADGYEEAAWGAPERAAKPKRKQ